ncbi:MAG: BON domain-containing protein [Thermomonas sp.]
MHTPSKIRNSMIAAALVLAFSAAPFAQVVAQDSGAAMQKSTDNQTVPDKAADAWITTKVKSDFGTTKGVSATDISVTTNDGVVMLSGNVASAAEKKHAKKIAMHVKGVKSVDATGLMVAAKTDGMKHSDMPSSSMSAH